MAGGSGTRFWPKSTAKRPKQLLSFDPKTGVTLLEQTLKRFDGLVPIENRMIVTTQLLEAPVGKQALGAQVMAEPQGRNTAPCVYWAAREVYQKNKKGIMLVMPADHFMSQESAFKKTVEQAADWARKHEDLVTLGVKPTRPETGYGYLKLGSSLGSNCTQVEAFVEKPNLEKAKEFVSTQKYLWNGGMFIWKAETILNAFDQFMPEMKKNWDAHGGKVSEAYGKLTATSIDYGVMEKAKNVVSFVLDCGWDDLGSWTSLEGMADILNARQGSNIVSSGECYSIDSARNVVDANGKWVALLGVNDLIIAQSGDALLIAHKDRAQDIKQVVEGAKKIKPELV